MHIFLQNNINTLYCHTIRIVQGVASLMRPTGIVRLPCKLLMAAWASVCPWNFTKAQPATKQYGQLSHMARYGKQYMNK